MPHAEELKRLENKVMMRLAVWLRANGWRIIPPELYTLVHSGLDEAFLAGWAHKAPGPWEDEITADFVRAPGTLPEVK